MCVRDVYSLQSGYLYYINICRCDCVCVWYVEPEFRVLSLYNVYCSWSIEADNFMIFLHWTEIREGCVCVSVSVCVLCVFVCVHYRRHLL